MANSEKNILITPSISSTTADPMIAFSGANSTANAQTITAYVYPQANSTVSFQGSAGQLLSITNTLTGNIFSVNDVSGIPSITVQDTGQVTIAPYTGNVTIGNLTDTGTAKVQITGSIALNGNLINGGVSATGNIGSTALPFNTVFAKATSAQYADLAETYVADNSYNPGTLVIFGGADEITASTISHDTRVAGVISTAPAYLMNSGIVGLPVALTGRVPCSVVGTIRKGDRLVASDIKGVATVLDSNKYLPGCIIGKSLEDYNSNSPGVIEVAIGRY
jgi:hypothetical protein